jgi:hypothetical protein
LCSNDFLSLACMDASIPLYSYLCSNDLLNLAWTRPCHIYICVPITFLTWRGRVHASVYLCSYHFLTWHGRLHAMHVYLQCSNDFSSFA